MAQHNTTGTPITDEQHPARKAARWYKRRCWYADIEDLTQDGFVATLVAQRTYDPDKGDLDGYLYTAAAYAIKPALLRLNAPVSAPKRKVDELKKIRTVRGQFDWADSSGTAWGVDEERVVEPSRAGVQNTDQRNLNHVHTTSHARTLDGSPDQATANPEIVVNMWLWKQRVIERLRALIDDDQNTMLALPVLLGEEESSEVAAREGVPTKDVYRATQRARRRIGNDPEMWKLWRSMPT